jgi:hypothetical protein
LTDPLGFLSPPSGFFGISFSITNSLPHFGQVRRLTRPGILSITLPIVSGARQCGQAMFNSRYGSLTSLRGAPIGALKADTLSEAESIPGKQEWLI